MCTGCCPKPLLNSEKICYITLNKTYRSLKAFFNKRNISSEKITFVDGITKTIFYNDTKDNCYYVHSPGALIELETIISGLLREDFKYLIFDSVSDLLTYKDVYEVEKFIENVSNLLNINKCKGFFCGISRYKYAEENRITELLPHGSDKTDLKSLIEEQIIPIDKIVDLRKKKINKVTIPIAS